VREREREFENELQQTKQDAGRMSSLSYNFILSPPRYCPQAYVEIIKDFKFQFYICSIRRSLFGIGILCFSSLSLLIMSV
jgi:hypothetical protein